MIFPLNQHSHIKQLLTSNVTNIYQTGGSILKPQAQTLHWTTAYSLGKGEYSCLILQDALFCKLSKTKTKCLTWCVWWVCAYQCWLYNLSVWLFMCACVYMPKLTTLHACPCIYTCMHGYMHGGYTKYVCHMYMSACVQVTGWTSVFLVGSPLTFWDRSSTYPRWVSLASLGGQGSPGTHLSLPTPSGRVTEMFHCTQLFMWVLAVQTQALSVQQERSQLNHHLHSPK